MHLQYNHDRDQARDDLAAIVSQRNNLVRDYDAQAAKFNWEPYRSRDDRPPPRYGELTAP